MKNVAPRKAHFMLCNATLLTNWSDFCTESLFCLSEQYVKISRDNLLIQKSYKNCQNLEWISSQFFFHWHECTVLYLQLNVIFLSQLFGLSKTAGLMWGFPSIAGLSQKSRESKIWEPDKFIKCHSAKRLKVPTCQNLKLDISHEM